MSNIVQWILVGALVVVATWYLVKKIRSKSSGKCNGCCENCSQRPPDK